MFFFMLIIFQRCTFLTSDIVKLSNGLIDGFDVKNEYGVLLSKAFLGIPYAEPPIDSLRFSRTKPKSNWKGVLQTKAYKAACPQNHTISPQDIVDENCLYLNVFVGEKCWNAFQTSNVSNFCAVIYYIHGGAYEFDSARMFQPKSLAKNFGSKDLILVTIDYRLGALGFWSTGTEEAPGNYALYDMIEGLRWTKKEISNFGGNNNRITVMGHSTGGHSASLLSITPQADGLFNQLIIMSGCSYQKEHFNNDLKDYQSLSTIVGCGNFSDVKEEKNLKKVVDCMRKVNANLIVNKMNELRCCDTDKTYSPEQISNFVALESNIELPERIMYPRQDGPTGLFPEPLPVMRLKRPSITTMLGATVNEYGHHNLVFKDSSSPVAISKLCDIFFRPDTLRNYKKIRFECRKNYAFLAGLPQLHYRIYSKTNFSFWTRLQTSMFQEYQYFTPILREMISLISRNCSKTYLYSLDYERSGMEGLFPWHSRDLTLIMDLHKNFDFDDHDVMVKETFLKLIENFVKFGDPTPNIELKGFNFSWPSVSCPYGSNYLSINVKPRMKQNFHKNANLFFNKILRTLEYGNNDPIASMIQH